jgi:hypothetical protein
VKERRKGEQRRQGTKKELAIRRGNRKRKEQEGRAIVAEVG